MSSLHSLLLAATALLATVQAVPVTRQNTQFTLINPKLYSNVSSIPTTTLSRPDNQTTSYPHISSHNHTTTNHSKAFLDFHLWDYNTLNGTLLSNHVSAQDADPVQGLPISIVNSFSDQQLYAYIAGLDPSNRVVLLDQNGQWYSPIPSSSTIPQQVTQNVSLPLNGLNQTTSFRLPTSLTSGRIYISEGELAFGSLATLSGATLVEPDFNNPKDVGYLKNWSYVELTTSDQGIFVDISYVDFVGLPLGISVTNADGNVTSVAGVNASAVSDICDALKVYAEDENQPWDQLCLYSEGETALRVSSPSKFMAVNNGSFTDYYTTYVENVYTHYTPSNPLIIATSSAYGNVSCTANGEVLTCNGANRDFTKPSTGDILACSGVFQIQSTDNDIVLLAVPILCAAFQRTSLLLDGGNIQPMAGSSSFYTTSPTNRYSELVHQTEAGGVGYAFAYDDVHVTGEVDHSGLISSATPTLLTITVGGLS